MSAFVSIRAATQLDVAAIAAIQAAAPEASQWDPRDYLGYECRVAVLLDAIVGFVVARPVAEGEWEILNLAVAPEVRRRGVGQRLLRDMLECHPATYFLEVRESNLAALRFYEYLGFEAATKRLQYYADPQESAIVMKLHSC